MTRRLLLACAALLVALMGAGAWWRMPAVDSRISEVPAPTPTESDTTAGAARSEAVAAATTAADPAGAGRTSTAEPAAPVQPAEPGERAPRAARAAVPMTPSQARERMQALRRHGECQAARSATEELRLRGIEEREWRWLPPEQVAREFDALRATSARVGEGCPVYADTQARTRRERELTADVEAAAAAGDLEARLRQWSRAEPRDREQLRAMLYDALLSGDTELIAAIGQYAFWLGDTRLLTAEDMVPHTELWRLVACDLGADCGAGSAALARLCLSSSPSACTSTDVESALRAVLPEWQWRLLEPRRGQIVWRIRNGRVAGLLDPPRPPPGGG